MLWDIYDKKDYKLYVNRAMDLKIKVYEEDDKNKIIIKVIMLHLLCLYGSLEKI